VRERFRGQISSATIRRLVEETSFENVTRQFEWFDLRDNSWARRGPVAAFVVYCRNEAGEPEILEINRKKAELQQQPPKPTPVRSIAPRRESDDEAYPWLLAALSQGELERIKGEVRSSIGAFFTNEDAPSFKSLFRTAVMKTGKIDALEVIPRSS
jgi:hypothetical protein